MKAILNAYKSLYGGAAFGAVHFDGIGKDEAEIAALSILECAQGACLERPIPPSEIEEACTYLSERNDKAALHILSFKKALYLPDQVMRFEATSQALRGVFAQFKSGARRSCAHDAPPP